MVRISGNFSLYKKMGGKFEFTRSAASRDPAKLKVDSKDEKNDFELRRLHTDV